MIKDKFEDLKKQGQKVINDFQDKTQEFFDFNNNSSSFTNLL